MDTTIALPPARTATRTSGSRGTEPGAGKKDPGNTSARGADGTSTRTPKRSVRREVVSPTLRKDVAVLKASGMSTSSIAKTLGRRRVTIQRTESLPDVKANIAELRQTWKQEAQSKVTGMAAKTWNLVEKFVDTEDSKQLDNTMRAVAAMEKVSASVSGEGQKVEVSGVDGGPVQVDARMILAKITDYVGRHAQ